MRPTSAAAACWAVAASVICVSVGFGGGAGTAQAVTAVPTTTTPVTAPTRAVRSAARRFCMASSLGERLSSLTVPWGQRVTCATRGVWDTVLRRCDGGCRQITNRCRGGTFRAESPWSGRRALEFVRQLVQLGPAGHEPGDLLLRDLVLGEVAEAA